MAYSKVGWENLPQKTTPLSADNLNHMDKGIAELDTRVTTLEQGGGGSGSGGVGVRSQVGTNNELFNNTASHTIESTESKNNHLEGSTNILKKTDKTYKNDSNHIEGENNIAGGYAGHAENSYNQVHETNAHAGGKHSVASGSGSFSQGRGVIAFGTATFATGQSAKGGDSNVTTLVDAEIDWATQTNEDEVGRAQRIAAKLVSLWHDDINFKQQFTAALGSGAMAGGVNTFVNGGSSFGHGYECEVTAQFGFGGGYQSKTLADGGFTWGVDAQTLGSQGVTFGISTKGRAKNGFVIGSYCENTTTAENSFTGGEGSQSQAKNAFAFGKGCYAAAEGSTAFGQGIVVGTPYQFAVGEYNNNESKAIFAVGGGDSSKRKNAFEVFGDYVTINGTKFDAKNILTTDSDVKFVDSNGNNSIAILRRLGGEANDEVLAYTLVINPRYGLSSPILKIDSGGLDETIIGASQYAALSLNPATGTTFGYKYGENLTNYLALASSVDDLVNLKGYVGESSVFSWLVSQASSITTCSSEIGGLQEALNNKQDKSDVIMEVNMPSTLLLNNNMEYSGTAEDTTSLALTFPSTIPDDYHSYFAFTSGATATTITTPSLSSVISLIFKGDDCNASGVFTPAKNKTYEVALKLIGRNSSGKYIIVARVGAC